MPDFSADLSVSSLEKLLSDVKSYRDKINAAPEKITARLAEIGAQAINDNIAGITDPDGNALGTVSVEINDTHAIVSHTGEQVAYLEYGTGSKGAAAPHEKSGEANWQYNSGERIKRMKNGKLMWRYYDKLKGHYRITNGLSAQRQTLLAAIKMRDSISKVAKEALK